MKSGFVYVYEIRKELFEDPFMSDSELLLSIPNGYERKTIKQFVRMVNDGEFDNKTHRAIYMQCVEHIGFDLDILNMRIKEIENRTL